MRDGENLCNASFLVYGPSKAGKSWLVASGPPPVLIMDAEGGTRFLPFRKVVWESAHSAPPEADGSWDVCVLYVRDFSTLRNAFQWLHSGRHPFRTVAVDSISEAQQRCVDAIAGTKQMTTPDWGTLLREIRKLVSDFRDLLIHPLNPLDCVAFTSMERVTQEGVHVPYLQGAIANVLSYYLDIVIYLRSAPDETTGLQVRKALTKPHPQFLAGDRTDRLPNVVEDPTLQAMLELACDLSAPTQGGAFPDLANVGVSDNGADAPQAVADSAAADQPQPTTT